VVNLQDIIKELFEDFDISCENNPRYSLLARMYFLIALKKPKNKHCKQMFLKRWCNDYKTKKLVNLLMLEFHKRLEVVSA
jgi:hypothetical protein